MSLRRFRVSGGDQVLEWGSKVSALNYTLNNPKPCSFVGIWSLDLEFPQTFCLADGQFSELGSLSRRPIRAWHP